ncbi:MAG: hypothetical protein GY757_26585, partial [bacterium]|nr:hypothetical protein [bacterium]
MSREKNEILFMLRSFKKHYHKVRKSYRNLSKKGSFSLNITARDGVMTSQHTIPDEVLVVRFMVLMRRFLSQYDPLYYDNFWNKLCSEFPGELPDVEIIENAFEQLKKGDFGLNIDGKDLTAEGIYDLISKADYFMQHAEAQKQLQALKQMPLVSPFLVDQFYGYSLNAFRLISHMFNVVKRIEDSESFKRNYPTKKETKNRCIYCLSDAGRFTSEEHVLP